MLDRTSFKFILGFLSILAITLIVIGVVNHYRENAETALNAPVNLSR